MKEQNVEQFQVLTHCSCARFSSFQSSSAVCSQVCLLFEFKPPQRIVCYENSTFESNGFPCDLGKRENVNGPFPVLALYTLPAAGCCG